MTRAAVDQLLYLMDQAFDGEGHEHSLLANLRSVPDEAWGWIPPAGRRSISAIVGHVTACKWMYDNHAFGDAKKGWSDPVPVEIEISIDGTQLSDAELPKEFLLEWLEGGQAQLRKSVAALSDKDLKRPRRTNWGEMKETRWIIAVMIEHDLYHAGEINHIRSLFEGEDSWAWEAGE